MSGWDLPTTATIGGVERRVRTDYRAVLDALSVMADPDVDDEERTLVVLEIIYEDFDEIPTRDYSEALDWAMWFVAGGKEPERGRKTRVMDWEQDFPLIAAPVNKVLGYEVRSCDYLHWWSFLAAYMEIGDCLFAQVVSIRKKKAKGEKLDKADQKFYRENRRLVDLERRETAAEAELFDEWTR